MNPKPSKERSAISKPQLVTLPNAEGEARLYTTGKRLSSERVATLYQSADGVIWIGTATSGLTEFDGVRFRSYTVAQGLSDAAILTIAEDSEGGLWMGTYRGGAMRLARNGFVTYQESDGLRAVGAVFEDHSGKLCVVTGNVLISRFDSNRFIAIRPNLPKSIVSWRPAQNCLEDRAGEWWFGTLEGLYRFPKVSRIEQLSKVKPKAVYTSRNGLPENDITRLFEDSRGDIWIGAFSPGREVLTRWSVRLKRFIIIRRPTDCARSTRRILSAKMRPAIYGYRFVGEDSALRRRTLHTILRKPTGCRLVMSAIFILIARVGFGVQLIGGWFGLKIRPRITRG